MASAPTVSDISDSVDWTKLQTLVLKRMQANAATMTSEQLNNILLHMQDPDTMEEIALSYADQIREIQALTDIGKKLIAMEIRKISQLHPTVTGSAGG
jgi:hypothetical protein